VRRQGRHSLPVGVPANPDGAVAEGQQTLERPGRHRTGRGVPADQDDRVLWDVAQHRLQRGQVAVDVVESSDFHAAAPLPL